MSESSQFKSVDKVANNHTYTPVLNYWAPLANLLIDDEDEDDIETKEEYAASVQETTTMQNEGIIIDSGATSHFATTTTDLPRVGNSNKVVVLPDGSKLQATHKAKLPFENLEMSAREADVLPHLKKSLMSVGQLSDHGYTTIFHPREEGVTVYKQVDIASPSTPVLQGCRSKSGLWEINLKDKERQSEKKGHEEGTANNVYSLPAIKNSVRYLHAAAGYPTKDTWIAAVKAGNYSTWPGLTEQAINRHFPEFLPRLSA
jgi:hypothetical protein